MLSWRWVYYIVGNQREMGQYPLSWVVGFFRSVSHVWLFCNPMDCSLPGSSVHGILQARILEWVAIFFSEGSSRPTDQTHISCISCVTVRFFTTAPLGKPFSWVLKDGCEFTRQPSSNDRVCMQTECMPERMQTAKHGKEVVGLFVKLECRLWSNGSA